MNQINLDQKCLDEVVNSTKLLAQSLTTSISGILNLDLEQIVLPRLDSSMQIPTEEVSQLLKHPLINESRKTTLNKLIATNVLIVGSLGKMSRVVIANYTPIINQTTKNIIAIAESLKIPSIFNLAATVHQFYKYGRIRQFERSKLIELTELEEKIIFFFLLKLDSATISKLISTQQQRHISKNMVDMTITKSLLPKFLVCNRNALYDKLYSYGYANYIPNNVLNNGGIAIQLPDSQI